MMDFGACSKEDESVTLYNLEIDTSDVPGAHVKDHNSMIKKYTINLENLRNCFY